MFCVGSHGLGRARIKRTIGAGVILALLPEAINNWPPLSSLSNKRPTDTTQKGNCCPTTKEHIGGQCRLPALVKQYDSHWDTYYITSKCAENDSAYESQCGRHLTPARHLSAPQWEEKVSGTVLL